MTFSVCFISFKTGALSLNKRSWSFQKMANHNKCIIAVAETPDTRPDIIIMYKTTGTNNFWLSIRTTPGAVFSKVNLA